MSQTIDLTDGAVEYTWPLTITEKTGKDITAATIVLSLGTYQAPGDTWQAPDVDKPGDTAAARVVQLLIGTTLKPAAGTYYLWSKVTDAPEVVPRRNSDIRIA